MELKEFEGQVKSELSLIEVAHAILEESGEIIDFTELLLQIQDYLDLSDELVEAKMTRFYTDLNIDGRFISLGDNRWGLRAWYAVDEIDEEIITSSEEEENSQRKRRKKRKHNAFADNEDNAIDYNDDDPEDGDNAYDYDDEEDKDLEEEDDEDDAMEVLVADVEEDDEDEELNEYASDLSELGEDEIDLDEKESFEDEDEDDFEDEDDEEE